MNTDVENQFARGIVYGCALGILSLVLVVMNADHFVKLFKASTPEEEADVHTAIPLLGGILGAIALRVLPIPGLANWWWIPFILDPGSAFLVLGVLNTHVFHIGGMRPYQKDDPVSDRSNDKKS